MKLLHIKVSHSPNSSSRNVSNYLVDKIKSSNPGLTETVLDLSENPIPHLSAMTIQTFFTREEDRTDEQRLSVALSDKLVDILFDSDIVVISSPMWNLGLPSVLKAWFDHVTRAGRTFAFTKDGHKVGLVKNKKVFAVVSSGSMFSEGAFMADDQFSPYIKTALAYIGIDDVQIIRVEGTAMPGKLENSIPAAYNEVNQVWLS